MCTSVVTHFSRPRSCRDVGVSSSHPFPSLLFLATGPLSLSLSLKNINCEHDDDEEEEAKG